MNIVFRVIFTVLWFTFQMLMWFIAWVGTAVLLVVLYPFTLRGQREDIIGAWFRFSCVVPLVWLNPFWHLHVLTPKPKIFRTRSKYIVMFNHLSNADGWIFHAATWPLECKGVGKSALWNIPFGGWCLGPVGHIKIQFTNEKGGWGTAKGSVSSALDRCRTLLKRGTTFFVCPEGARSAAPDGPLQPFKDGFFKFAVEEGAKIVPLVITGTDRAWPLHSPWFDNGDIYVSMGEPISFEGHTPESLRDLVWTKMNEMRDSHPDRQAALRRKEL